MATEYGTVYLRRWDRWWYFKVNGKPVKLVKLPADQTAAELARADKIKELRFAPQNTDTKLDALTCQELCDRYMVDGTTEDEPHTVTNKRRVLNAFCQEFGTLPYNRLDPETVKRWILSMKDWTAGGRRHAAQTIKRCFNYWVLSRKLTEHILAYLRLPEAKARGEEYAISLRNYRVMMEAAPRWLADIMFALMETGCRPSEVLELTADEYVAEFGIWRKARHKTSKKGCLREIKLSPKMVRITEERIAKYGTGRLYRGRDGGTVTASYLSERLKELAADRGIPDKECRKICGYSFRHRWAVDALEAGLSEVEVASFLGHTDTGMLRRHYGHTLERVKYKGDKLARLQAHREKEEAKL